MSAVTGRNFCDRAYRFLLAISIAGTMAACGDGAGRSDGEPSEPARAGEVVATDDAGRPVRLDRPAQRLISLLPATTEVVVALGGIDRLVARTSYDTDPDLAHLPSIGGGLTPSIEQIVSLQPDLVIAWEEAGVARLRPRLEALRIPVFALRTEDTTAIFANIERLGRLTGLDGRADSVAARIRGELDAVRAAASGRPRPSVLYMISVDPPIIAGPNVFIGQLLDVAGGDNVFPDVSANSPQMSLEEIVLRRPEIVLIASDAPGAISGIATRPGWRELAAGGTRFAGVPADSIHRPGTAIGRSARILYERIHEAGESEP